MSSTLVDYLLTRKSVPIVALKDPGPSNNEIETMIRAASRVPDHGGLTPWRFILYRGDSRREIGEMLAERLAEKQGPLDAPQRDKELTRFSRAPLVIGVVSSPKDHPKIPEWEMFLSAGAAAMNLVHAANALGFGANWITNWYSDDEEAARALGIGPGERAVGFVHIGTPTAEAPERPRPSIDALLSTYSGRREP